MPIINDYWERAQFPFELVPKIAQLGVARWRDHRVRLPGLSRLGLIEISEPPSGPLVGFEVAAELQ